MPAEYTKCVESYVKRGVSSKTAKARCAAVYYKRHGITVNEAHKKGLAELPEEISDGLDFDLSMLIMSELSEIGATISASANTVLKADMHGSVLDITAVNVDLIDEFNVVEIIATMVGAHAYTGDGDAVVWTEEALAAAQDTWKMTRVSKNHDKGNYGRVLASFMEGRLLKMVVKVDDTLKEWIKKAGDLIGVSIEATKVLLNKSFEIISAVGSGVTFVFPPHLPACSIKEGCGIVGTDNEEENAEIDTHEADAFIPADAGDLPSEAKKIFREAFDECREKDTIKSEETKELYAKVAWTTVKETGFSRNEDGTWTSTITPEITGFSVSQFVNRAINAGTIDGNLYYPNTLTVPNITWVPWIRYDDKTTEDDPNITIAPYNKNEGESDSDLDKEGEIMAEETPKTICAEKHEAIVKAKDAEIEELKKKMGELETVVASFEAEKKAALLDQLKAFVDIEQYEEADTKTIETVLGAMKSFKEKVDNDPIKNSGAVVQGSADEQTDETGKALSNAISEAEKKAKEEAEILAATWAKAETMGYRKP